MKFSDLLNYNLINCCIHRYGAGPSNVKNNFIPEDVYMENYRLPILTLSAGNSCE